MTGIYGGRRHTVAITGASGMIGSALARALEADGHRVVRITRRPRGAADVQWDPIGGQIDAVVIHGLCRTAAAGLRSR